MAEYGSGGTAPLIVSLGHKWRRVVSLPLRPFFHRVSSPRYPLDGLQRRSGHYGNERFYLTFVYPCIVSAIVNDDQQDATILAYLFISNQLYMFRAMSSPETCRAD